MSTAGDPVVAGRTADDPVVAGRTADDPVVAGRTADGAAGAGRTAGDAAGAPPRRYVVVGAGAVGGVVGGLLAEAGAEVVLVARGEHLAALRERGLGLATAAGHRRVRVISAGGPDEVGLRGGDVLLLAVKSQHTAEAVDRWAERPVAGGGSAGSRLLTVCLQNGVGNEAVAARRFDRVAGCCVWLPATFLEPGEVSAGGTPVAGVLTLGMVAGEGDRARTAGAAAAGTGAGAGELRAVAADLERAGFRAPVVDDVMAWKRRKLLGNLANAVEALCGTAGGPAGDLRRAAVAEGEQALAAAGVPVVDEQTWHAAHADWQAGRLPGVPAGGSTWQSLARGAGSVEVDHLNGEVVRLGAAHGVPTPVNATLADLVHRAASQGAGAGTWTPEQVAAEVAAR